LLFYFVLFIYSLYICSQIQTNTHREMTQKDIKTVSKQLKMYDAPRGRLLLVGEDTTDIKLKQSNQVRDLLMQLWPVDTIGINETFGILYLNRTNKVKCFIPMFIGGLAGTVTDARMILAAALLSYSTGIILTHNHPSGNTEPSQADKDITTKIKQACDIMQITLLDHVILTPKGDYFSFADNGLI